MLNCQSLISVHPANLDIEKNAPKRSKEKEEKPSGCWLFSGVIEDLKNRSNHYFNDWTSGMTLALFTTVIYMFCVTVVPTLTFGAILCEFHIQAQKQLFFQLTVQTEYWLSKSVSLLRQFAEPSGHSSRANRFWLCRPQDHSWFSRRLFTSSPRATTWTFSKCVSTLESSFWLLPSSDLPSTLPDWSVTWLSTPRTSSAHWSLWFSFLKYMSFLSTSSTTIRSETLNTIWTMRLTDLWKTVSRKRKRIQLKLFFSST